MATVPSSSQKIPFSCPHCGHYTEVELKFAGRSGPCVGCSNIVSVPTYEQITAPAVSPIIKPKRRSEAKPLWIKVGMGFGAVISLAVIGVIIWALLQPAFEVARSSAKCAESKEKLGEIGQAIEDYYQTNGHYPPAFSYDESNQPLHSWRVLILPHLGPESQMLAKQIKLDEPFDSTHNSKFVSQIPQVYQSPADDGALQGETSYLAIVGSNTLINYEPSSRKVDHDGPVLRDHPYETMVVVEAHDCGVNWMSPKDISMSSLSQGLNSTNKRGARSNHPQGVNILMADQTVICLKPESATSEDLRGMATIDGGNEYIEVLEDMEY